MLLKLATCKDRILSIAQYGCCPRTSRKSFDTFGCSQDYDKHSTVLLHKSAPLVGLRVLKPAESSLHPQYLIFNKFPNSILPTTNSDCPTKILYTFLMYPKCTIIIQIAFDATMLIIFVKEYNYEAPQYADFITSYYSSLRSKYSLQ
jgi:hypothetical protein